MDNKKFAWLDVIKASKFSFIFSSAILLLTIIIAFVMGVKLDIQFTGGTIVSYSYEGEIDVNAVETEVNDVLKTDSTVTKGSAIGNEVIDNISVSIDGKDGLSAEEQSAMTARLQEKFKDNNIEVLESTNVAATEGKSFFVKCLAAVVLASALLILYIGLRFKKIGGVSAGVCGIIALLHDIMIIFAVMIIFGLKIDSNFMAAVLIILGYSINDTIIIYDRIRENRGIYGDKFAIEELVNLSVRQTLGRTINTTITTLTSVIVIAIVCSIYSVTSIYTLIFPLLAGMLSGTYSTIFIACPLWVMWKKKKAAKK